MHAVGLGHIWGDDSTSLTVANLPERPKGCLQKRASKDCRGSPAGLDKQLPTVWNATTTQCPMHRLHPGMDGLEDIIKGDCMLIDPTARAQTCTALAMMMLASGTRDLSLPILRTRRDRGYRGGRPGHVQTWQLNWHHIRCKGPSRGRAYKY
eukprot:8635787-Pyramimonas_sp.AAC.1